MAVVHAFYCSFRCTNIVHLSRMCVLCVGLCDFSIGASLSERSVKSFFFRVKLLNFTFDRCVNQTPFDV